jgi:hypothetical protein
MDGFDGRRLRPGTVGRIGMGMVLLAGLAMACSGCQSMPGGWTHTQEAEGEDQRYEYMVPIYSMPF